MYNEGLSNVLNMKWQFRGYMLANIGETEAENIDNMDNHLEAITVVWMRNQEA